MRVTQKVTVKVVATVILYLMKKDRIAETVVMKTIVNQIKVIQIHSNQTCMILLLQKKIEIEKKNKMISTAKTMEMSIDFLYIQYRI